MTNSLSPSGPHIKITAPLKQCLLVLQTKDKVNELTRKSSKSSHGVHRGNLKNFIKWITTVSN